MMELRNLFVALMAGVLAGCAWLGDAAKPDLTEPEMAKLVDPNPFANYDTAMKSSAEFPLTVNWQDAHKAEVAAVTDPEALGKIVANDEFCLHLLQQVKSAYETDPLVMQQISAITQYVMAPETSEAAEVRARWAKCLLAIATETKSAYHALFCLDQLRWCARSEDAAKVHWISRGWVNGSPADARHVREFAAQVEREIAR